VTGAPKQFGIVIITSCSQVPGGLEVLTAARHSNPSVYVVMITGYVSIDSAVRAVREGAYRCLAKPFALGRLEVALGGESKTAWPSKQRTVNCHDGSSATKSRAAAKSRGG